MCCWQKSVFMLFLLNLKKIIYIGNIGFWWGLQPGWKSGESKTEIAYQIYMQFLHINICTQILYKLLCKFIYLPIYKLRRQFIQTQIHMELTKVERQQIILIHYTYQNSKHENIYRHKSQTMDNRLLFFLASTAKVMSTVKTLTLLFQANNEWYKTIRHDIATWISQILKLQFI